MTKATILDYLSASAASTFKDIAVFAGFAEKFVFVSKVVFSMRLVVGYIDKKFVIPVDA